MEQQELQKNIALYYSKLPPESQKLFSGMNWLQTLEGISKKHNLSPAQEQTLGTETTLVLLGLISLEEYEQIVKKDLGGQANQMLEEINNTILIPIRPELAETFKNNSTYQGDEKLDERFDNLSERTREAIIKSKYYATLFDICQKYKLNVMQSGDLEIITTNVMTGALAPDKLERTLKEKIKLPDDKTRELVNDINDEVLKKIRENLMIAHKPEMPTTLVKLDLPELESRQPKIIPVTTPKVMEAKRVEVKPIQAPAPTAVPQTTEPKPEIHTLLTQKLTTDFQMPKVETNHSLKPETPMPGPIDPKIDPYREMPE